jgi:7-cyano-7-deazaguanine reductase
MDFEPLDKNYPMKGEDAIDTKVLDTFPYEYPERSIDLEILTDEFTSICPFSGLPDFGTITIQYVPDKLCIELRSLKYYLLSYRHVGMYYEHVVNRILEDLVTVCKPVKMTVIADYTPRGGLTTKATAKFKRTEP